MDLPTARELELETLLREKDAQLAEVTDEVLILRQYLAKQPGPSTTDPVTLPPAFVSVLLPHITNAANNASTNGGGKGSGLIGSTSSSSTVTAALTQRAKLLQEQNDELYELLKHGETGKLKDEVRGLKNVVKRLENALKDSHTLINTLSAELEKAHETIRNTSRLLDSSTSTSTPHKSTSNAYSPKELYGSLPASNDTVANSTNNGTKLLPTEPRAHKRPRLSETSSQSHAQTHNQTQQQQQQRRSSSSASPALPPVPPRLAPSLPQKPQTNHHHNHNSNQLRSNSNHHNTPSRLHHHSNDNRSNNYNSSNNANKVTNMKMEVDDVSQRMPSPVQQTQANTNRDRHSGGFNRDRNSGSHQRDRDRRDSGGVSGGNRERDNKGNAFNNASGSNNNPRGGRLNNTNGHTVGTSIRGAANNPNLNNNFSGGRGGGGGGSGNHDHHHRNSTASAHHLTSSSATADASNRTLQERLGL